MRTDPLVGSNLRGAKLQAALLDGAILEGAKLEDALLNGTNLHGARLRGASLRGAQYDCRTVWPAELVPSLTGAVPYEIYEIGDSPENVAQVSEDVTIYGGGDRPDRYPSVQVAAGTQVRFLSAHLDRIGVRLPDGMTGDVVDPAFMRQWLALSSGESLAGPSHQHDELAGDRSLPLTTERSVDVILPETDQGSGRRHIIVPAGTVLEVTDPNWVWFKVRTDDGRVGYIMADQIAALG